MLKIIAVRIEIFIGVPKIGTIYEYFSIS